MPRPHAAHHFSAVLPLKTVLEVSGLCSRQLRHRGMCWGQFWGQDNVCLCLPVSGRTGRSQPQGVGCARACSHRPAVVFAQLLPRSPGIRQAPDSQPSSAPRRLDAASLPPLPRCSAALGHLAPRAVPAPDRQPFEWSPGLTQHSGPSPRSLEW